MPATVETLPEQQSKQAAPCTTPGQPASPLPVLTPECEAQPECPFAVEERDIELLCGVER